MTYVFCSIKKTTTILVAVLITSALLPGCGKEPSLEANPSAAKTNQSSDDAAVANEVAEEASANASEPETDPTTAVADQTPRLVILPFALKGEVEHPDTGSILADLMLLKVDSEDVQVYESCELPPLYLQSDTQPDKLTNDRDLAVGFGREHNIRYIVLGELSRLGSNYYLTAQLLDCESTETTATAKTDFDNFDTIADNLADLSSQLGLAQPRSETASSAEVEVERTPAEQLEQRYLDGQITPEQAYVGFKLFEKEPGSLNEFDAKRITYFQQLLAGEADYKMLQRGLDLTDASEKDHLQQVQENIDAEKQARITSLLEVAKQNNNQRNSQIALDALDQLLDIEPDHTEAQLLRADVRWFNKPSKVGDTWTNSIGMSFAYIPRGYFLMGSQLTPDEVEEKIKLVPESKSMYGLPQHKVTLTKPLCMAATEVTREQFEVFIKETGYRTSAEAKGHSTIFGVQQFTDQRSANWRKSYLEQGENHPVVHISWQDATAFCAWLSKREGRRYRLPTEAEWEYACRAGSNASWSWGAHEEDGKHYANMADKSANQWIEQLGQSYNNLNAKWDDGFTYTAPVGSFKPNNWGIYDMQGNASEWCSDYFGPYSKQAQIDPQGPRSGKFRVLRGGSWLTDPWKCRIDRRQGCKANTCGFHIGFRIALELDNH